MVMLTRRTALAMPAALLVAGRAWAKSTPDLAADVAKASIAPVQVNRRALLTQVMQKWIDESGFVGRSNISLNRGMSSIAVPPTNPDWVRYRMIAYADAILEAQAEFVSEQAEKVIVDTQKQFVKGAETPPSYQDTRTPGQAAEVVRKLVAVANGSLDGELAKLGVDPRQYEQAPEPQQTVLLRNQFKMKAIRTATADLIGMTPVMSFEAQDGNGGYAVGVVVVASNIMKDFALQVASSQGDFKPNPARAQDLRLLYKDQNQLLNDFGVRRQFDSQGLPVIVSFAQWGSAYRGTDPAFADEYEEHAAQQAETIADTQIADFLSGSLNRNSDTEVGQETARIGLSLPDNWKTQDIKKLVDRENKVLKRHSGATLVGLRTLYNWVGKHPACETPIVGVIRYWSAASEQTVRARQQPAANRAAAPENAVRGTPGVTQSRSLMDLSDF